MPYKTYTFSSGTFTFSSASCVITFSRVQRNRFGSVFGDVSILTPDGKGHLAQDHGEISSERFRQAIAATAAKRNSGSNLLIEDLLLDAYLSSKDDPLVAQALPVPAFVSAADFAKHTLPELPEVVTGLIAPGRLYVVAAKPKSGKTILLMNMALAVAGGRPVLGRVTRPGRVAFFQLEDSERTLQKRLRAMCPGIVPHDLLLHLAPFRLVEENFEPTLLSVRGCSLVICDPIVVATEIRDWNAQDEVRRGYDLWRRLARESDASVVLSAHHRKMEGEYGDALAGSIQAMATVDGILEMYRSRELNKTERRLSYLGRDWGDIPEEVIRLNQESLTWEIEGGFREVQEQARGVRQREQSQVVLEALPSAPPGLTYAEIEAETGMNRDAVRDCLKVLGTQVQSAGKPKSRTTPIRYWRAT